MKILVCDDRVIFRSGVLMALSEIPGDVELLEAADTFSALDAGTSGFIPKSSTAPLLCAALEVVLSGGVYIVSLLSIDESTTARPADLEPERRHERAAQRTPRRREILVRMSRGLWNREIGEVFGIAPSTIKTHLSSLFEILDFAA